MPVGRNAVKVGMICTFVIRPSKHVVFPANKYLADQGWLIELRMLWMTYMVNQDCWKLQRSILDVEIANGLYLPVQVPVVLGSLHSTDESATGPHFPGDCSISNPCRPENATEQTVGYLGNGFKIRSIGGVASGVFLDDVIEFRGLHSIIGRGIIVHGDGVDADVRVRCLSVCFRLESSCLPRGLDYSTSRMKSLCFMKPSHILSLTVFSHYVIFHGCVFRFHGSILEAAPFCFWRILCLRSVIRRETNLKMVPLTCSEFSPTTGAIKLNSAGCRNIKNLRASRKQDAVLPKVENSANGRFYLYTKYVEHLLLHLVPRRLKPDSVSPYKSQCFICFGEMQGAAPHLKNLAEVWPSFEKPGKGDIRKFFPVI